MDIVHLEIPIVSDSVTLIHYAVSRYEVKSNGSEQGKMARVRTSGVEGTGSVLICSFSLCLLHFLFISLRPR